MAHADRLRRERDVFMANVRCSVDATERDLWARKFNAEIALFDYLEGQARTNLSEERRAEMEREMIARGWIDYYVANTYGDGQEENYAEAELLELSDAAFLDEYASYMASSETSG